MREKITICLAGVILIIVIPCLLTLFMNGRHRSITVEMIDSGRDVLFAANGENVLMDVEQYIVGVLPGVVDYGATREYIEAQAVAVRTKIYFAMGDSTVVDAESLSFEYFDEEKYMNKYGMENYQGIKKCFEEAVINTTGEVIQ
ncbi:MAG: SpoIID/LytB domain-containing protein [Lachnospiraceae bacterium]|nr:SpoIID/LytB domain-containing protein [Lachnospiraceae bacterium]MBQ8166423.1 SpoIID/LytB domain-containing protein [Lachnospiraceae bacterium]